MQWHLVVLNTQVFAPRFKNIKLINLSLPDRQNVSNHMNLFNLPEPECCPCLLVRLPSETTMPTYFGVEHTHQCEQTLNCYQCSFRPSVIAATSMSSAKDCTAYNNYH